MSPSGRGRIFTSLVLLSFACNAVEAQVYYVPNGYVRVHRRPLYTRRNQYEGHRNYNPRGHYNGQRNYHARSDYDDTRYYNTYKRSHGGGYGSGPANNRQGNGREYVDRTDSIRRMPVEAQKDLFKDILNSEGVNLNGEVEGPVTEQLPQIIDSLANGAIDILLSQFPVIGTLLKPLVSGGLGFLTSIFGKKKVYIPNMPPVITCPPNVVKTQDRGMKSAIVEWNDPVAFDAEDGQISNIRRRGKKSGSRISGEETVQYIVKDKEGRKDTCTFYIKVEVVKCRPPPLKRNLQHNCSSVYYGDTCSFSCPRGYNLVGPEVTTCTRQGFYDKEAPSCQVNTCPAPKLPHGALRWDCSDFHNYKSACTVECAPGFRNVRDFDRAPWNVATIECQHDGTWTSLPRCKDVSAPDIDNCPGFTKKYADRGKDSTRVDWNEIRAYDTNSEFVNVTQVKGPPSGSIFTAGAHEIEYIATDNVGLTDKCTFYVNVEVRTCPVPELTQEHLDIECKGQFAHGDACNVTCRHGITLQGSSRITCEAVGDEMKWNYPAGKPTCLVKKCPRLPVSPNANLDCFPYFGGKMCHVKCRSGYIPARNVQHQSIACMPSKGVWTGHHPGCVKKRKPKSVSSQILFSWKTRCSRTDVPLVTAKFKEILSNSSHRKYCPTCRVENVRSLCRRRRDYSYMMVRWSIKDDVPQDDDAEFVKTKITGVGIKMRNFLKDNPSSLPLMDSRRRFQFRFKETGSKITCDVPFKPNTRNLSCAACAPGYQFNGKNGCELCPEGTYQDDSGDATCKSCPTGTQTVGTGKAKSIDCKYPCKIGTVSPTGLTPCRDCPVGEYQNSTGQTQCKLCPTGQITPYEASGNVSECYAPPSEVLRLRATAGSDSVTLNWVRPDEIHGILTAYTIEYDTDIALIDNNRTEEITLSGLQPNTTYTFTIWAHNERGRGIGRTIEATTENPPATTPSPVQPARAARPTTPDPNLCPPGTTSMNGRRFSDGTCQPCGYGFYQDKSGQTDCEVCEPGLTTWYEGSDSAADCVDETWTTPTPTTTTTTEPTTTTTTTGTPEPCPPGTVSKTGFKPGCRKCQKNKIPRKNRQKCRWCPHDGNDFVCSPKSSSPKRKSPRRKTAAATTPAATTAAETTTAVPETTESSDVVISPDDSNKTNLLDVQGRPEIS